MRRLLLAVLLSATANAQWDLQDSHTTASLRGIHNVGGGVAWASGTEGTVLRTEDGGYLWQGCATPPGAEHLDFRGIQAFDENTAIVMSSGKGDLSRLYKTTDGCQSWKLVFTNPDKEGFWDAIQFNSRDNGVLIGDPVDGIFVVVLTFDGGIKWERQTLKTTQDINGESVFAASNSALLLTGYPGYRRFCTGGRGGPRIISFISSLSNDTPLGSYEHDDAKLHYFPELNAEKLQTKSIPQESSGCFSLADDNIRTTTVAVGGDYQQPNDSADTAWTTASMSNRAMDRNVFHLSRTPPHGYRSAVAYSPDHKAWITVGPNGTDLSTDDGRNWRALKPGPTEPPDADRNWNALSLPFAVGPKGRIGRLRPDALPHK